VYVAPTDLLKSEFAPYAPEPPEVAQEPDELVPEPPLSRISAVVDPTVPAEPEPLDVPDEVEPLDVPDEVEPLDVPDEVEPLDVPDKEDELAGANFTASAQVDEELDLDSTTTFACPEKLTVPSKYHLPAFSR